MDNNARQIVTAITRRRATAGESFTAFDITTEARGQGAFVPHGEARDLVQALFQDGEMGAAYRRTVVNLGGGARPFVYHRFDVDASTYQSPSGSRPIAPPPTPASPTSDTSSPSPQTNQGGIIRRVMNFLGGSAKSDVVPKTPVATTLGSAASSSSRRKTLNLDASAFLPITRDEMMRESRTSLFWSGAWFGRLDLIPPTTDRRTLLIDRGMMSAGLLSAEQLAEIHRIGDLYSKYAKDVQTIQHAGRIAGQAAVDAERKTRAEAREKKKAEAIEKREKRRAEIEHRKQNDIVFLGRRVSGGLADRESDVEKLRSLELPVLSTPAELAAAMEITIPNLRWLAFHADVATRTHYVSFDIQKKSGGLRRLSAPHKRLKAAQTWILENVLCAAVVHDAAHGFVPGRSTITGAKEHVGQAIVLNADLENFFPSIHWTRVRKVFQTLGYSPAVAAILALVCTECPRREVQFNGQTMYVATGPRGLPQGACTSPMLSNMVALRLDRRLVGLANKFGLKYTRYADDLTLSGGHDLGRRLGYVMARLRHIAADEGFAINESKTRVQRRHQAQSVTGLIVNDRVSVSRSELRRLRAILHSAKSQGLESQNRDNHPDYRGYLTGLLAYVAATRPALAAEMKRELDSIRN